MNRTTGFIIFFLVFFSVFLSLHYYVFYRFSKFFSIRREIIFYIIMVAFALSFIVASFLERYFTNILTRAFYIISATWMGVLWFLFCSLIVYEILKLFIKISPRTWGIAIIIIVLLLSVFSIVNALLLNIKLIEIPLKNLKKETTILQISDVHLGTVRNSEFMDEIVEKTNKLNPDIVLITGDLFDGGANVRNETIDEINKISAPVFYSIGNHEIYAGLDEVLSAIKNTKIKLLRNEVVESNGIQIAGVDHSENKKYLETALPSINKTKPAILMYHPPDGIQYSSKAGYGLQLSGHTHNGQVWPFTYLAKIVYPHNTGLFRYNGTYLYVTPGAGTWGPPMRFGSRSEIVLFRLVKG